MIEKIVKNFLTFRFHSLIAYKLNSLIIFVKIILQFIP